jgi:DNA replication and repair protein RecF
VFLSSLSLSHFRSHRRVALALDARPIALYGRNGAGKTNLIEAVSLLSPGRGLRRATADELARLPERVGWRVDATIEAVDGPHDVTLRAEPGASRQVTIDDAVRPQTALGRLVRAIWLVPSMDRLWIEGAEGRRRFLDRMALSFFPDHAQATVDYEKAMRERNRLLKDKVRDPPWYAALEAQMAAAGAALHANRSATLDRLTTAQADDGPFPFAALKLVQTDGPLLETESSLRAALADSRSADMAAGRALAGPHRSDLRAVYAAKGMPAERCSTGEQKALLISLILANARAIRDETGTPPLILLDEVAAHLDADRRTALYDQVCALEAQAWMTGTGPELFADLGDRAQHFEVRETGGASEVLQR